MDESNPTDPKPDEPDARAKHRTPRPRQPRHDQQEKAHRTNRTSNSTNGAKKDRNPSHDNPDALGRMEEQGHEEELPKDLPKVETRRMVIIASVLIVLAIGLFLVGYIPHRHRVAKLKRDSANVQNAMPTVEVVQPKRTDAAIELYLPGNALPMQQTSIYPRANGYLKRLYVDIGDRVKEGQLLAEIDTPEVDAQLATARANVEQAQANATKALTDYNLATATLTRYKGLFDNGGVTQQQLDERQNAFEETKHTLAATKAAVESAQAEVQRLAALQSYEKVIAPFAGVITIRNFDVGALLNPSNTTQSQPLFGIDRTDILRVFVNVPQVYSTSVRINQPAQFTIPGSRGDAFEGSVARSAGALDTRTLRMEVDFPNPRGALLAGMYGQVTLRVPREAPQIVVPTSALLFSAEGLRVALVNEQKKIHYQKIVVGRDFGTEVEVTSGLSGQEQVVANPGERLGEGIEVKATQAKDQGKENQGGGRNSLDAARPHDSPGGEKEAKAR